MSINDLDEFGRSVDVDQSNKNQWQSVCDFHRLDNGKNGAITICFGTVENNLSANSDYYLVGSVEFGAGGTASAVEFDIVNGIAMTLNGTWFRCKAMLKSKNEKGDAIGNGNENARITCTFGFGTNTSELRRSIRCGEIESSVTSQLFPLPKYTRAITVQSDDENSNIWRIRQYGGNGIANLLSTNTYQIDVSTEIRVAAGARYVSIENLGTGDSQNSVVLCPLNI